MGENCALFLCIGYSGGGTRAQTAQQVIAGTEKTHSTNDGGASEKGAAACLHRRGINLEMLKPGCACHYTHFDNSPDYAAAGSEARAAKRGLWSAPHPINPYDFRKAKRNGRNGKN